MAFKQSLAPLRWFWTWSQRSMIRPQSSDVFFASVTFSVIFRQVLICEKKRGKWLKISYRRWCRKDLGPKKSPFLTTLEARRTKRQRQNSLFYSVTADSRIFFFLVVKIGANSSQFSENLRLLWIHFDNSDSILCQRNYQMDEIWKSKIFFELGK